MPPLNKPAFTMIGGLAGSASSDTTNASNITTGVLGVPRGGTGLGDFEDFQVLLGNIAGGLDNLTLVAGDNISIAREDDTLVVSSPRSPKAVSTVWTSDGNATEFYPINGFTSTDPDSYIIIIGGLVQIPNLNYTINNTNGGTLVLAAPAPADVVVNARALN